MTENESEGEGESKPKRKRRKIRPKKSRRHFDQVLTGIEELKALLEGGAAESDEPGFREEVTSMSLFTIEALVALIRSVNNVKAPGFPSIQERIRTETAKVRDEIADELSSLPNESEGGE